MQVEIKVTGMRFFKIRAWIGARIMKLAALIIGCGFEIKSSE